MKGEQVAARANSQSQSQSQFRPVASVLAPRSVAVVGASERARWPALIITNLKQQGYRGKLWLVNPNQRTVFGEPCFPSLAALPETPDHALVIVPAPAVLPALQDAERLGISSATVYASRIGDGDDAESHARGAQVKSFLSGSRIRMSGPNCMGSNSFHERLFGYPTADTTEFKGGSVGAVFQSGGLLLFFMKSACERGVRLSYALSSGNELDLDLADYLNFLVDDPKTEVITLFIEGIRRPEPFMVAAGRALAAGKPVLVVKTGASASSVKSAQSHTGAIAGDHAAFLAMCDRYGIVVCRSLDDLVQTALAFQRTRRPKGRRMGFISNSGGAVDLLYDLCESEGAELAQLAEATHARLAPLVQEGIKPKNPLDVGIPAPNETSAKWCEAMLADPAVDLLAFGLQPRNLAELGDAAPFQRAFGATNKTVLGFSRFSYQVTPEIIDIQDRLGIPILMGLDATVRAMNALCYHADRQGKAPPLAKPAKPSKLTPATLEATLESYGIYGPRSRLVRSAKEAADAAAEIGFPVALKIRSADILHKTEAGGVALGLANAKAVAEAARKMRESALAAHPTAEIDGYLVQEMASGIEVIVGARTDPLYGPLLLVGAGGILVELTKDAVLELLPVTSKRIGAMLDKLKVAKLLDGFRGRPPADRKALEAAIAGVARFYLDHRAALRDIEINPIIVRGEGEGVVAVDVRAIWNEDK